MSYCDKCNPCDPCKPCGPAAYGQDFSIMVDPFNEDIWNVTIGGKLFHVNIPPIKETDTKLSDNYTNATLVYSAERHTDALTGNQIGQLINVGDLRDTTVDYETPSMCYELVFHKYGDCGQGCQSVENGWSTFSPDNEHALQDQLYYVRGTNQYGCPKFLDIPTTPAEWWWSGWRTEGEHHEFGYFQPREVPKENYPKDENGNHIFISQIPSTKEPVASTIPLDCIWNNILGNLGFDVNSEWSVIEQTPQFGASFNNMTGDFVIKWSDWNDMAETQRAGYGRVYGQLAWTVKADIMRGAIAIHITSVNFYRATWTMDQGITSASKPSFHLYGVEIPNGTQQEVLTVLNYGGASWERAVDVNIPCDYTLTLMPGQSPTEPLNFAYIWVDWVKDDRGYLGARFKNRISGWVDCI